MDWQAYIRVDTVQLSRVARYIGGISAMGYIDITYDIHEQTDKASHGLMLLASMCL